MICNFSDKETEKIYNGNFSKKLPESIQRIALRKLMMINAVNNLRVPPANQPANHLERLSGKRAGQYNIRINKECRICFFVKKSIFINI